MRSAEAVLGVIRDRGRRGLPLERVYRLLFNRDLFLLAYGRIAKNRGALTPGTTDDTADGMSLAKLDAIIEALRFERYRWTPVRRVQIPKANGKTRPLGIPTWSDKLVQEVLRLILDAYYEPQFSDHSHGFRSGRGCHTALSEVQRHWAGTTWFLEGDISAYFDRLDHELLLAILAERIHDGRFLALIRGLLKAGYLEDWKFHATLSGTPQGGIVSPILANIYLDRFDQWVETRLLPAYNRGETRAPNLAYVRAMKNARRAKVRGDLERARQQRRVGKRLPSQDPTDPTFRRLRYVRYADDFLLGFAGPRVEAEEIKRRIGQFLKDTLRLDLSEAKTLITHARSDTARFLGYEVGVLQDDTLQRGTSRRRINGRIALRVPRAAVLDHSRPYLKDGKPVHRPEQLHDSVFSIVARYQAAYRGVVQYHQMAHNVSRYARLKWIMETSLTKTLAAKLRISVHQVYQRYGAVLYTNGVPYKGLRITVEREGKPPLVAEWGRIPLKRNVTATLVDQPKPVWNTRTDLEQRLLANTCELCGAQEHIEVHHIRALKRLQASGRSPKPRWVQTMAARQRKTLVVCRTCHGDIQHGHPPRRVGRR